ncbi:hypothetical protein [Caryophanon tenue]|uniref:Gram-positive cocci surface proteins LPxTG domain-containing protein n=1 Tax=Caryophanon tenue TaxID=33978 RepID=A0A1C0YE11_9BACL|nr:hypothetical protein [Caryophanon tenue]OCS85417.1 hypothetical protein A6M13_13345 [Caryophanon tenue]
MRCNLWLVSCVVIVSIWIGATPTAAAQDERSVLLMYYGNDDSTYSNTIFLDATLTGIFTNVSVQSMYETTSQQLQQTAIVLLVLAALLICGLIIWLLYKRQKRQGV